MGAVSRCLHDHVLPVMVLGLMLWHSVSCCSALGGVVLGALVLLGSVMEHRERSGPGGGALPSFKNISSIVQPLQLGVVLACCLPFPAIMACGMVGEFDANAVDLG